MQRRLPFTTLLFLLTLAAVFAAAPAGALGKSATCDPRTHGAKGDSVTKDTAAIQAAIDACAAQGGGTVSLPAGTYLSGTLELKSNLVFRLEPPARPRAGPEGARSFLSLAFRAHVRAEPSTHWELHGPQGRPKPPPLRVSASSPR